MVFVFKDIPITSRRSREFFAKNSRDEAGLYRWNPTPHQKSGRAIPRESNKVHPEINRVSSIDSGSALGVKE